MVETRFGNVIREEFGIEPAALTSAEAAYIANFRDADSLRDRIAKARQEARERDRPEGARPPARGEGRLSQAAQPGRVGARTPTSEFAERAEAVAADLRKRLESAGLSGRAVVNVVEQIRQHVDAIGHTVMEGTADGDVRAVIDVALSAEDPTRVLNHEAVHALRGLGLFRQAEWSTLDAPRADTGREAILDGDGRTFAQVEVERLGGASSEADAA